MTDLHLPFFSLPTVFGPLLIYGVRRLLVAFGTVSSMLEFNVAENVLEQISREV